MKYPLSHFISAVLGAVFASVVLWIFLNQNQSSETLLQKDPVPVQANSQLMMRPDFIEAAAAATPSVVHIEAEESEQLAQQRLQEQRRNRRDPFRDFFQLDDGFFFDNPFFGQPFYRKRGSGSGVFYSEDGFIITNNHVVEFADKIKVTLNDDRVFEGRIIGKDPSTDLAVIKIEGNGFPVMELGNSDKIQVGEWVLAVGNPFDYLTSTVTAGIVSAKGRDINIIKGDKAVEEFIQTDAAINPGNSGGALVDSYGRLVGINTAIATPTGAYAGYSFAIPINLAVRKVREIIENKDSESTNLGITAREVDEEIAAALNTEIGKGLLLVELDQGGTAHYAGLLPYDLILRIDGVEMNSFDDLEANFG